MVGVDKRNIRNGLKRCHSCVLIVHIGKNSVVLTIHIVRNRCVLSINVVIQNVILLKDVVIHYPILLKDTAIQLIVLVVHVIIHAHQGGSHPSVTFILILVCLLVIIVLSNCHAFVGEFS